MGRYPATFRYRTAKIPGRHDSRHAAVVTHRSNGGRSGMFGEPGGANSRLDGTGESMFWTHDAEARCGRTAREWPSTQIWRAEEPMLQGILVSLVWVVANFAYGSYLRDGERGFKCLAAFWLGFPLTLCSGFFIPRRKSIMKSRRDEFEEDRELLMEIRRDRARRLSGGQGADEGADVARDEEA